jgi:PAS domain S-box-containing protein
VSRAHPGLLVGVFVAYFLAGRLGLGLASLHASASPMWPPTGIALAALLLTRHRAWPAVLAGAFAVNVTTSGAPLTSFAIAIGNTLEAVVGAWLVHRFANGASVFERAQDFFRFVVHAAMTGTAISATIGVTALAVAGSAPWSSFEAIWLTWWLGDAAGALVWTPALVLSIRHPRLEYGRARRAEAVLMVAAAVVLSAIAFGAGAAVADMARYPLSFLAMPPLMWAAFRFGPREASVLTLLTSLIATWGTLRGVSPFAIGDLNIALLLLQGFTVVMAGLTLPTAAVVAERRRGQQRLYASELAYRAMFEANPHPMWVVDRETLAILAVNDAALARYGYSREEFLALTAGDLRPSDDVPHADRRRRAGDTGRSVGINRHRTKDGRIIDVEVTAHGIEFGGRIASLILAYDVTEQTRARRREADARQEAEAANRAKDDFLATLSHELRTPLNAMLGWIVMLRNRELPPDAATRALETIERNTRLQARLIEDLLDISRIIANKIVIEVKPVALGPVIAAAVDAVRPVAVAKSIAIEQVVDPGTPAVLGDTARLQQIVWNLLSNAVKFTRPNGRVIVTLSAAGKRVRIAVSDTGEGIAPAFLPHVFDRFRQAETASTRRHGGLGLGLAIVQHLVTLHGGSVRAESDGEGLGATFTVELAAVARPAEASDTAPRPVPGAPLAGVRVLVVDDDRDTRLLTVMMLENAGAATTEASSVAKARVALSASAFHVVVADIAMPIEDGFDLIRHVRTDATTRTLPCIAFTAYAGREDRRRVLDAGYDAYLPKPAEPRTLVETVGAVVSGRGAG